MNGAPRTTFQSGSLATLRHRLLDLTARNRLLNFTHGRQGNVRASDELPDELHRLLLSEEELRFKAIPDPTFQQLLDFGYIEIDEETGEEQRLKKAPTAIEWARLLGLESTYDLPVPNTDDPIESKHRDKAIQTLMFPSELESRLRGLRNKAETAIEETGANICHMAFGILEWFDGLSSDRPRYAPLLLVPVRIAKGRLDKQSGTYHYTIAYTGEDILPNLSLREKLRLDFNLELPDLDEDTTPEHYFRCVCELIGKHQPRWTVRRWTTLALFNFSKLLMYLDLDPERWPSDQPITDHPIVSRFFSAGTDEPNGGGFGEEHAIDDLPNVHDDYPIIEDADSSQHSALVDAIQGRNLVIEGPPGTGKSQTITNLIAAALAQGKRVLFMAEKLAALEVVKRRLDQAGLGDFCLELHSHKTQKRKVLDDIARRLQHQNSYRQPEQIEADIGRYEGLKDQLRGYAELINSDWKQTDLSIHQILVAASRYRQALDLDPAEIHPRGYDGDMFTPEVQRRSLDAVRLYVEVYHQIAAQLDQGDLQGHPWYGVGNRDLQLFDKERVCATLFQWQDALNGLVATIADATALLGAEDADSLDPLYAIQTLAADIARLPPLHGDEVLSALPHLRGEKLDLLRGHLELVHRIQNLMQDLAQALRAESLRDGHAQAQLAPAHAELTRLGLGADMGLGELAKLLKQIDTLQSDTRELGKPMTDVALGLGNAFTQFIKLSEEGLSEFRTLVELVGKIKPSLLKLRGEIFDDDELDDLLPALAGNLATLQAEKKDLGSHFALDRLPDAQRLDAMRARLAQSGLLRWFDSGWRATRRDLLALASKPGVGFGDLASNLDRLYGYVSKRQALEQNTRCRNALGPHFAGMDTQVSDLAELRTWYKAVRGRYGVGFGPRVALGEALLGMRSSLAKGIQSLGQQGYVERTDQILRTLAELKQIFARHAPIQQMDAPLVAASGPWSKLRDMVGHNIEVCQGHLKNPNASLADVRSTIERIEELELLCANWINSRIDPRWFGERIDLTVKPEDLGPLALSAAEHTRVLADHVQDRISTSALREAIYRNPSDAFFSSLSTLGERLAASVQAQVDQRGPFEEFTQLDLDAWQCRTGKTLSGLLARNQAALDKPDWLSNWLDYVRVRHQTEATGFAALTTSLEQGKLLPEDVEGGYQLAINDLLARQILKEIPALAQFSGNAQLALQKQFQEYDDRLKGLQRERIAWRIAQNTVPAGSSGGLVSTYTDEALLRHECGKKTRHIPVRQLVRRAGNALAALKPCFMMGPMSVAQYLAPGAFQFDMVVMDEASQIKPEDALGTIARGHQLVVVGDPKQLPPTSFFDRMADDGYEDTTAIAESESILETATPLFDARRLRWHYRSRHEQLIAFSNHAFYDGNLVVFPAPHAESEEFGVKLTPVPRGRFVNRRNIEEARTIAKAVRKHLLHRPEETLGVVAMSADQRDQIERAVEDLSKDEPLFQKALEASLEGNEPLFLKNLENVQGDERDVIYISCTYGPEEIGGRVYQRFGPINSDLGWRRLNVLFTRAKKRMHVFSSMGAEDIRVKEQSKRGVRELKNFLTFAETGHLHQTIGSGHAPDSDFEVAVMSALSQAGFECMPQVGVAGFFIDVAVRDPGNPGRYLMGIECDGESYHSAKSVRDRDRLRQEVLERLGWRIERIWSTDWYRNPQAEIGLIIRELNRLKTAAPLPEEAAETPETVEIAEIAEQEKQQELLEQAPPDDLDLRAKLLRFDRDHIRSSLPDTAENQRLLRPAMLEALLEFMPVTKSEFVESIPLYLRQATDSHEGAHLDRVLRIIEESEGQEIQPPQEG